MGMIGSKKMSAAIIQFGEYRLRRQIDLNEQRLRKATELTGQLQAMCSQTVDMADDLAQGLTAFGAGMDIPLQMLAEGAERQRWVMQALDSGDLAEMERCRDLLSSQLRAEQA
jgi:hypothetical protein